jgi:DNA-binding transcriptional MerR regulator
MKVGELAKRLGVQYRHVRYLLEEGFLPAGVNDAPGRGEHRDLTPVQAFWVGFVLSLKTAGVNTPRAAEIAELANRGVRSASKNLSWDNRFDPFKGEFETTYRWYVDVGDMCYIRVATTANPSRSGRLEETDWTEIGSKAAARGAEPLVILRVDVSQLAKRLSESPSPEEK